MNNPTTISIVFTGGGTTGHVTKNKILLEELKKTHPEVKRYYLGLKTGKEAELISSDLAEFHPISSGKLRRYFALETIPDFFKFLMGIWQSYVLLGKIKPRLVFSSGGFVALPVAIGAWLRSIPLLTHETDSYPGLANRIIGKIATKIFLGFESAAAYFDAKKVVYAGNPVSPALLGGSRERALQKLGFSAEKNVLLVMGGSQGAQQINELVGQILPELVKAWQVLHLTGAGKGARNTANGFAARNGIRQTINDRITKTDLRYEQRNRTPTDEPYRAFDYVTTDYPDFLAAADLVISRAGGNSLAEIEALGKTAILIPLPLPAAAGDHQRKNAEEMMKKHPEWKMMLKPTPSELLDAIRETKILSQLNEQKRPQEAILAVISSYLT